MAAPAANPLDMSTGGSSEDLFAGLKKKSKSSKKVVFDEDELAAVGEEMPKDKMGNDDPDAMCESYNRCREDRGGRCCRVTARADNKGEPTTPSIGHVTVRMKEGVCPGLALLGVGTLVVPGVTAFPQPAFPHAAHAHLACITTRFPPIDGMATERECCAGIGLGNWCFQFDEHRLTLSHLSPFDRSR